MDNADYCEYLKFLSGDPSGFENVFRTYRNGMILFVRQYVPDYATAEDVTQDVFAKIWLDKPEYNPRAGFKTWLYTIARNEAVSWLRKNRRRTVRVEEITDTEDDWNDRLYADERKAALGRACLELKPEYRRVLYLHYYEEMPVSGIAELEKKTPRQISDLLYNAKKALRSVINGSDDYEILRRSVE